MRIAFFLIIAAGPAWAEVSEKITRTVAVSSGAAISVEIAVGDVVVRGWDRDEVVVEIVRRAPDAAQLARVPAEIKATDGGLAIRALQAEGGRDARLRTDIVLRVPSAAQLREIAVFEGRVDLEDLRGASSVRIERGPIDARRLSGAIRFETAMGRIRLDDAALSPQGVIRLRTFNGDVSLELGRVPPDARILALSMGGTITSDIPLKLKDRWGPRFGEATLGKGEPVISIDVVNGDVGIRVRQSQDDEQRAWIQPFEFLVGVWRDQRPRFDDTPVFELGTSRHFCAASAIQQRQLPPVVAAALPEGIRGNLELRLEATAAGRW